MKKITDKELKEMLKSDKELAGRLKDYVGQEKNPKTVEKKIMNFMKQEGYEVEVKIGELSADDLENVSGGIGWGLGYDGKWGFHFFNIDD